MRDGKQVKPLTMSVISEEASEGPHLGRDSARPNQMLRAPTEAGLYDEDHDAAIVRTLAA